jgi:glucose/arabinose dehydrogenase
MSGFRACVASTLLPFLFVACGTTAAKPKLPKPSIPAPDPRAASVPPGYRVEIAFAGLMYPSSIEFDDAGRIYVAECGYMPGDTSQPPRILRFDSNGSGRTEIASAGLIAPVTDLLWHDNELWVSHKGKVSVLASSGVVRDVVTDLPSLGDHSNNQLTVGRDGKIYFGIGTATNAGVVGPDNFAFGWPLEHPEVCEVPAKDVVLTGEVFETEDPRAPGRTARTSAYQPFGRTVPAGTVVPGRIKANGTILRMSRDGSGLEVFAWGFRNPYGLAWGMDNRLYCADAGSDERGSRHIANAPEKLWVVEADRFYGWPDFVVGKSVTDASFAPAKAPPQPLWQRHPRAEEPWLTFEPHASATQIDVCREAAFARLGTLFVGASGDMGALTAAQPVRAGYWVKSIDPATATTETFFTTRREYLGPGELEYVTTSGPRRPVDVRFDRTGHALYVVDIGPIWFAEGPKGPEPVAFPGTGVIWRIVRGT